MALTVSARAIAVFAAILTGTAGQGGQGKDELRSNPAWSPDGKSLAFQAYRGGTYDVGVMDIASRKVTWIEDGPGHAAYPVWTPSGGLVYTYGHDTLTALGGWRKSDKGYGLRLWENGTKTDLTTGRCRDYTPSVAPDGRTVYFTTSRWTAEYGLLHMASDIASVDLATRRIVRRIPSPGGDNSGLVQPDVSPDGRYLAWSELDSFIDGAWRIRAARIDSLGKPCYLTAPDVIGYAPRWHPKGRYIAFTGFVKGDPGWCVYVVDTRTGAVARQTEGENPAFSPDGDRIAYDRDGRLHIRAFGEEDRPKGSVPDRGESEVPKVFWRAEASAAARNVELPADLFALGSERTFFVRLKGTWNGVDNLQQPAIFVYGEHALALQFFIKEKGSCYFSIRDRLGGYRGVKTVARLKPGQPLVLTGVRTANGVYVSLDGAAPQCMLDGSGFLALDHPKVLRLLGGWTVEAGTGWPEEIPRACSRKEVFE